MVMRAPLRDMHLLMQLWYHHSALPAWSLELNRRLVHVALTMGAGVRRVLERVFYVRGVRRSRRSRVGKMEKEFIDHTNRKS